MKTVTDFNSPGPKTRQCLARSTDSRKPIRGQSACSLGVNLSFQRFSPSSFFISLHTIFLKLLV